MRQLNATVAQVEFTDGRPPAELVLPAGPTGPPGVSGVNGTDGAPGVDGRNGTDSAPGVDGRNGTNGRDGADGRNGTEGVFQPFPLPKRLSDEPQMSLTPHLAPPTPRAGVGIASITRVNDTALRITFTRDVAPLDFTLPAGAPRAPSPN